MDLITQQVIEPLRASGELAGGYNINLAGTADKLRSTWTIAQVEPGPGRAHHVSADGRDVRIVDLSVRRHRHRADRRRRRLHRACGCSICRSCSRWTC